jgi:MFS family permease
LCFIIFDNTIAANISCDEVFFMIQDNKNSKIAYAMWFAISALFFYQFIARSAFPTVLTEQFMKYFQIDTTGVGILASCYYWVYTAMQVPAGMLVDKIALRKIAVISATCCAGGVLLFISTSDCYIAGCGQVILGFGSSFVFMLALKIISSYFRSEEIAMKSSFTMMIGCAGPVIGGPAVASLVQHFDWINLMKVFAIFGLLLAAVIGILIKNENSSGECGKKKSASDSLKTVVSSSQAWVLALYSMAQYAPLSALGDLWGVSFLKKAYDIDSTTASVANNMLYVGMVIGTPTFAYLSKVWNSYKKPMILGIVGATASMAAIIVGTGLSLKVAFLLFFTTGFSCGATLAFALALVAFPPSVGATVSGFINMITMASGVVLMPLIGYIVNWSWDGTIENGVKVYSINDFKLGLTSVLVFLAAGVLLSLMIQDRSPQEKRAEEAE